MSKLTPQQEEFLIFLRTKYFWGTRLKTLSEYYVHIPMEEVEARFFQYPKYKAKEEIQYLKSINAIGIKEETSHNKRTMYKYKCLLPGDIDPQYIEHKSREHDNITRIMYEYLLKASHPGRTGNIYFDTFLSYRHILGEKFFTIDLFSGRVHTPVTSLSKKIRPFILLEGCKTVSLDVATMQPNLLGKILKKEIGENEFSQWIDSGKDIYIMLQEKAQLRDRETAKKKFFNILFSRSNENLATLFGDANWITWVNEFKSIYLDLNPHSYEKHHSNLAWLLQTTEVSIMKKVWEALINNGIMFLSVHDEIIVKENDTQRAYELFESVLKNELVYFKINVDKQAGRVEVNEPIMNKAKQCNEPLQRNKRIEQVKEQPQNYINSIEELENYFLNIRLPKQPIKLNQFSTITDCQLFIESHLATIKANKGNSLYSPYLNRLHELKQVLNSKLN